MARVDDMDALLRDAYVYVRRHGTTLAKGRAYFLYQRVYGKRPTTFLVGPDGQAFPFNRAALLAEFRLLMLRQGLPPKFIARWDRAV